MSPLITWLTLTAAGLSLYLVITDIIEKEKNYKGE